ncbi:zinc finger protein ZAT9-like [Abrus precatorius]|uniref:Zinc finger protein ZAT9-like n=1 Tax=Abrus precatorius TaxID=3816 RepID=A0A8B8JVF9_ABRPR|nr:zinc finger protein ZAT9-like [Abrus precatorius]
MMEKHKCKLCFRSFSNGRALGGHMRSHMMNLTLAKPEEESSRTVQLSFEAESASSSSSSEDEQGNNDDDKGLCYGLRENPKRSIRLVDPEFSFAAADTGCVILQDRESETESSKNNPTRRRSKRAWKLGVFDSKYHHHHHNKKQGGDVEHEAILKKKVKFCKDSKTSWVDHEPASSVSDATTEEDVAVCLMMLSRDKWKRQKDQLMEDQFEEEEEEEEEDDDEEEEDDDERSLEESDESQEMMKLCKNRVQGRYKCETCNKVFRSYQALGGHRASHKKIKVNLSVDDDEAEVERGKKGGTCAVEKKIHECPVCFRVFASGQALGGHKRTHVTGSANTTVLPISTKLGNSFIDLNLPAPIDDDDASQFENSAVSDAEFVKTR